MDKKFMEMALSLATKAYQDGEVPVGAVIVKDGKVISRARNMRESKQNALCHAEILAIDKACQKLHSFRLDGCEIYVTLEPCPMCAGAISNARLSTVIFGANDKQYGCAGSKHNFFADSDFEHHAVVVGGIMIDECKALLKKFFSDARKRNKLAKLIGKSAELLPQKLSTKSSRIVDNLNGFSTKIAQRKCKIEEEIYSCVLAEAVENYFVLGIVRMKTENVLILGGKMREQELLDFAKSNFHHGNKLITKEKKYLL